MEEDKKSSDKEIQDEQDEMAGILLAISIVSKRLATRIQKLDEGLKDEEEREVKLDKY